MPVRSRLHLLPFRSQFALCHGLLPPGATTERGLNLPAAIPSKRKMAGRKSRLQPPQSAAA